MINMIIAFSLVSIILICFNFWLNTKNGKKWLRDL